MASTGDVEEERLLEDARSAVQQQSIFMNRALDQRIVRDALKAASGMISELRTSKLSPRKYYELYVNVVDKLADLETYFRLEDEREQKGHGGRSVVDYYENVQHAGNIIPRLYLLITVGAVYIRSKRAPAKDILFDLVELCRGVQHPMRGLFLRDYLSQVAKDKLPDTGNEYEGMGGTVKDSIEFILQNFSEMNKLWVRMQHQGAIKDRARREEERRNLRQLIGTNLIRLANLSGVDVTVYKEVVLPRMLEQVLNCRDVIAQDYLMNSIILAFPDEFHLVTLEQFLQTCTQLQEGVNVKDIIINLMNRLAKFAKNQPEAMPRDVNIFPIFSQHAAKVIETARSMQLTDKLALQVALLNFSTSVYPDALDHVDKIQGFTVQTLKGSAKPDAKCLKQVSQLLTLPLEALSLRILELTNYGPLMEFLGHEDRKRVSITIVQAMLKTRAALDTLEKVDALFKFITPLIKDEKKEGEEEKTISDDERAEFDAEQQLVARLFHLIHNDNTDKHYKLYVLARKYFGMGGPHRIEHTLPPVVFQALELAKRVHAAELKNEEVAEPTKKILDFVSKSIAVLSQQFPELALRLFLHAAVVADRVKLEANAYDFVSQAFLAYEDEIADSKAQSAAINLIVATLQTMSVFSTENYETLVNKATQHSAKLLKKMDQCRAVANAAHLFWPVDDASAAYRDDKRVLTCLQRALKIANSCSGSQVLQLFVEMLNKCLFFFDRNCPSITPEYITGLISLIEKHLPELDTSETSAAIKEHYENTRIHIKSKQLMAGEAGKRYALLEQTETSQ